MARCSALFSIAALVLCALPATAHEVRPLYIELNQTSSHTYQLRWKTPLSVLPRDAPNVTLPKPCEIRGQMAQWSGPDGLTRKVAYHCIDDFGGDAVAVIYPRLNPSLSTLVSYTRTSGQRHITLLPPEVTSWTIPRTETRWGVAREYTRLGIWHIWAGADHLLFVVCLLGIAGTWRRILITISGFTIAHSVTLVTSALQIVHVPAPPVEATIALSLVIVARELVKGPGQSVTWRHPIAVSSLFGLLHGFGFATALTSFGLPRTQLTTGLLFFNLGVEIGQLLFASAVVVSMRLLRSRFPSDYANFVLRTSVGYIVGAPAAYWLIDRSAGLV
jgi:hydrogenase/urease accessory protein HupE